MAKKNPIEMKDIILVEVKELPNMERQTSIWIDVINNFLNSGKGIVEVRSKRKSIAITDGLRRAIRKMGLNNKVWTMTRCKKSFIINIERTGLKRIDGRRKY